MKLLLEGHSLLPPRTGVGRVSEGLLNFLLSQPTVSRVGLFFCALPWGAGWRKILAFERGMPAHPKLAIHKIPLPYGVLLQGWNRFTRPRIETVLPGYSLVHGPAHVFPPCARIPGILTIHDTSVIDHPEWYPPESGLLAQQILAGIQHADAILVPSHYVKAHLVNSYAGDEEKITVVPNPFRGAYRVMTNDEKAAFQRRHFGRLCPYLIWLGELGPRKNLDCLLSIVHTLKHESQFQRPLVMLGKPGYQSEQFFAEVRRLGLLVHTDSQEHLGPCDILLTGYVGEEEKKDWLAAAEALVFPSHDEGFGYPILEAMASGVPVVCSSQGALPEVAGGAALIPPLVEGPAGYVARLQRLFEDGPLYAHHREMGLERARNYASQQFPGLLSLYEKLQKKYL
ncbi:MAG: glycosyltransferase family 1 protein [bacterium]|jgi:glycosyltransferase involved in cell wall biosynthesis|nr:glycosyltransferase family 1 protein [bacterium]